EMDGDAPDGMARADCLAKVVRPGPSRTVLDQVTLLLAMIAPAPVNTPPLRMRASLKIACRLIMSVPPARAKGLLDRMLATVSLPEERVVIGPGKAEMRTV